MNSIQEMYDELSKLDKYRGLTTELLYIWRKDGFYIYREENSDDEMWKILRDSSRYMESVAENLPRGVPINLFYDWDLNYIGLELSPKWDIPSLVHGRLWSHIYYKLDEFTRLRTNYGDREIPMTDFETNIRKVVDDYVADSDEWAQYLWTKIRRSLEDVGIEPVKCYSSDDIRYLMSRVNT